MKYYYYVCSKIIALFSSITNSESRVVLLQLFASLTSQLPALTSCGDFLRKANAWFVEQVDEPNYFERIDAFHAATQTVRRYASDVTNHKTR